MFSMDGGPLMRMGHVAKSIRGHAIVRPCQFHEGEGEL